jgi:hypothetical protein
MDIGWIPTNSVRKLKYPLPDRSKSCDNGSFEKSNLYLGRNMSRYRGPRLRITRRLGPLPGLTRKDARRAYPPGQHGQNRKKRSEYAIRLEEKQKLRMNYGVTEKQMLRYVRKARRASGSTGLVLLQLLEMRLDNTVFRMAMAPTIPAARQVEWSILLATSVAPAMSSAFATAKHRRNWSKTTSNIPVWLIAPVTSTLTKILS